MRGWALEVYTRIVSAVGDPTGKCYAASEALYHALGGKAAGLTPQVMHLPGGTPLRDGAQLYGATHWYLKTEDGVILDPTVAQFADRGFEHYGRGCGFRTKQPSAAAQIILQRAGL